MARWTPELHCCTCCHSHVPTPAVSLGSSQPGSWPHYSTETTALLVNKYLLLANPGSVSGLGHRGLIPRHWTLCSLGISAPPTLVIFLRRGSLLFSWHHFPHPTHLSTASPCRQRLGPTILFFVCTLQRSWFYLCLHIYHLVLTISTTRIINWLIPTSHIYNCVYNNFFFQISQGLVRTLRGTGWIVRAGSKRGNA